LLPAYSPLSDAERPARVAAVILAAGKSSRMGEPKQLLRLGEMTMLGQTIDNVRRSALREIILVLGGSAEAIRRHLAPTESLQVVVNPSWQQGVASSLRAGLSAVSPETEAALIVLADQPFVRPETLNRLAGHHRQSRAQIVIPTHRGVRGNPVLLDRSVFAEVMALEGDVGCRAIFGSHLQGITMLELEDEGILLDIDNQGDYERLRSFRPGTLTE
jgi:molybdenum cofactor cytidylyltransferase